MPNEFSLGPGLVLSFLLTLSRIVGTFAFIPIPGIKSGPDAARILVAVALTIALFPFWPAPPEAHLSGGTVTVWILSELTVGAGAGLAVGFLLEGFQFTGQMIAQQAGYAFATTIDPGSQADSGVLLVIAQLFGGCLFFAAGLDLQVLRCLAASLQSIPPGSYTVSSSAVQSMIHLGGGVFTLGLRLAMPEMALLLFIDLCFAILGRMLPQIQFLPLSFPLKMLAGILVLSLTLSVFPGVSQRAAQNVVVYLSGMAGSK